MLPGGSLLPRGDSLPRAPGPGPASSHGSCLWLWWRMWPSCHPAGGASDLSRVSRRVTSPRSFTRRLEQRRGQEELKATPDDLRTFRRVMVGAEGSRSSRSGGRRRRLLLCVSTSRASGGPRMPIWDILGSLGRILARCFP